jgi:cysteinyl-tRNA synthetase
VASESNRVRIFDTLKRGKVELEPRQAPHIGLYVCGVTVYDLCHLGHARCYTVWDTLVRHLRARGYEVKFVRNITDVDDRIIKRAAEEKTDTNTVVKKNIAEMYRDFDSLGLLRPDLEPRATEHVAEMIAHIQKLVDRGAAYPSGGDVYFSVDKFADYGQLSGQPLDDLMAGARVEPGEKKKNPLDFVLWKGAKPGEPEWPSPWGPGRPGWHIECSAMSEKYLGTSFDVHTGGKDLVFPHHQNEIAQSQGLTGPGTFAKYWMHNGFVNLNAEKMSKSTGNFFTIRAATDVHDPEALRLFLLSVHYRSPINIEVEQKDGRAYFPGVAESERRLEYFYGAMQRLDDFAGEETAPVPELAKLSQAFAGALDDDLNTAVALATFGELAALANKLGDRKKLAAIRPVFRAMAGELGLLQQAPEAWLLARRARLAKARNVDEAEVDQKIGERNAARATKDFKRADELRAELAARGIELMDTPSGTRWRFKE